MLNEKKMNVLKKMDRSMNKSIRISVIADRFNLNLEGDDREIDGLGLSNRISDYTSILSYVTSDKYIDFVKSNKAISCLVISNSLRNAYSESVIGRSISYIITENPEICFYEIHEAICKSGELYEKYDFHPQIGDNCNIAPSVVIEKGVIIGNNVTIGHNSVIRAGSVIEDNTTIGCCSVIGSEGFQLITNGENPPMHITHVGKCHIGSDVYVGDNVCICNSLFGGETYVGKGSKISNFVHIAHNIYIGQNAVITCHVALCGSCRIEDFAWIAPNTSVLNRVVIGKGAKVGLGSVVTRDVAPYTVVYGNPAKVHEKKY